MKDVQIKCRPTSADDSETFVIPLAETLDDAAEAYNEANALALLNANVVIKAQAQYREFRTTGKKNQAEATKEMVAFIPKTQRVRMTDAERVAASMSKLPDAEYEALVTMINEREAAKVAEQKKAA